jgi:uncharacterized delta-60 repeat protein
VKRLFSFVFSVSCLLAGQASQAAPAGQLDPTFGAAGIRTIGFNDPAGSKRDDATAMAKGPDGRIYLVGSVNVGQFKEKIGITRLSPDGAIDNSFGVNGRVTYAHPAFESITVLDAAFQSSGRLIVVGSGGAIGNPSFMACGFKMDGSIDATFGDPQTPGCRQVPTSFVGQASSLAIQPEDGRILMAGLTTTNGLTRGVLIRLTANGGMDNSFDFDGLSVPFDWLPVSNGFNDVTLAPNGDIIAVGFYDAANSNRDFFVARFEKEHGQRDMSFGDGSGYKGIKFDGGGDKWDEANSAVVLADGSVLVAGFAAMPGDSQYRAAVAKLDNTGQPYFNWNGSGRRTYDPCIQMANGCDMRASDILVLANGQVAIAGGIAPPGNPSGGDFFAMRLASTSAPDPSFGTQQPGQTGTAVVSVSNGGDSATRMAVQGSRLVLAGIATPLPATSTDFAIIRLDHGLNNAFTVSPSVVGNGTINPAVPQIVAHSSHVNFTVTPAAGHSIKSVTGCGGALVGNVYTTGPITQNCQVVATFASHVTLTYLAGDHGSIQGPTPQVIPYNTNGQQVTAVPDDGYMFDRWSDFKVGSQRTDFNVTSDITVTALFKPKVWKLVGIPTNAGGNAVPVGGKPVLNGETDSIVIQPDPGFGVESVSGCGGTLVGNAYVVGPMFQSCYFDVTFVGSDALYKLTYDTDLHCNINGEAEQTVASGFDGSEVVATADDGYVFLQWSDGNKNAVRQDTHVFNHIKVTAQCAPINAQIYTVTPKFGFGGALSPFVPQLVAENNSAQFSVLPSPGYAIDTISGCDGSLDGNVYTTAPVTANCNVEATFVASNTMYSLAYAVGFGGLLEGDADQVVISGGSGTPVEAVANPGRYFVQWSDGSTDNPRQDTNVIANVDVTAQFAEDGTFLVTPIAGAGGTISPDLIQVANPGDILQFTVTPKPGYAIEGVEGCGGSLDGKVYTTAPIEANCKVLAAFVPSDTIYLLKYAAGPHGSIIGNVEQPVISGGSGTPVTAMPEPGYIFLQWSDGSIQNPRQDVAVIADVDVTAQFVLPSALIVTPIAGIGGSLSPDLMQAVSEGELVQFEVLPDPGFAIDTVGGTCGGSLDGNVFTTDPVTESCTVEASFVASDEMFTLTYTAGPNGTVNGQPMVQQQVIAGGAGQPVEAIPTPGFFFVQWSDGSQENPRTDANIIGDISVTAQFALNGSLVVTPNAGLGGSIEPWLAQVVNAGDMPQFSVLPDPGFAIAGVGGTCGGTLEGSVYTTDPVTENCTVEAVFTPSDETFTLTYTAGANGLVNGQAMVAQDVISGGMGPQVTAQPNPGYFFVQWSDGSTDNPRTDANVIGDIDVTAQFAPNGSLLVTPIVIGGVGGSLAPGDVQFVAPGGFVQFTVKPNLGYAIGSIGGTCGGSLFMNLYTTDPVNQSCTVEVTFVASDAVFELTYLAGPNGTVNGQPNVVQNVQAGGNAAPVTAVPANGYFFVKWSDGWPNPVRQDTNVVGDITVTAEFAANGSETHIVTPVWEAGGSLWPNVPLAVVEGENAVFTVKPNPGFGIAEVTGCDGTLVDNKYVTAPVVADCEVHASFVPSNEVFMLSYVAGPNGQVNGQAQVQLDVAAGESGIEIEAQPANGFFFVQWSDGSTDNPRVDGNVAADIEVTAQFAANGTPVYVVTPKSSLGGAWSPPVPQQIAEGASAQFELIPNPGYAIVSVQGTCGGSLAGNLYTTDPIVADCTVEAVFAPSDEVFTLTYIAGPNGLVNGQNVVMQNVQTGGNGPIVTAQPSNGFVFVQWSDGSADNPRQDTNVAGDLEVTAQFAPLGANIWQVTSIAGAGGTITPLGPQEVAEGQLAQFTITPNDGYAIESVGGTCTGTLEGNVFTTDPIMADCTVEVSFFYDRIFYNGFGFGDEQS